MLALGVVVFANLIVKVDQRRRLHIEQNLNRRHVFKALINLNEIVVVHVRQFVRLVDEMLVERLIALLDTEDDSRPRGNLRDDVFEEVCLATTGSSTDYLLTITQSSIIMLPPTYSYELECEGTNAGGSNGVISLYDAERIARWQIGQYRTTGIRSDIVCTMKEEQTGIIVKVWTDEVAG